MDAEAACDEIAASQHGVLSREQAMKAGLSARAIERRISSARWKAVLPGVYVPRPVPPSWHQRLMSAVLSGGHTALVSHRAAAALWELDGFEEQIVEISLKAGRRIRGALAHRRRPGDDPPVAVIAGLPVTGIERTLLDVASQVGPRRLGAALDHALRRRLTTLPDLRAVLASVGPKGRPGSRSLRGLLAVRDERDAGLESALESALLGVLRDHGLPPPVPQHVVTDGRGPVARLDFAYPESRLGIEADGYRWHGGHDRWVADLRRENRLKLLGWTLLRFSWWDVREQPERVALEVRAALRTRSQPPTGEVVS